MRRPSFAMYLAKCPTTNSESDHEDIVDNTIDEPQPDQWNDLEISEPC